MVFIDDKNLVNRSGTKTICCQIMALKFVSIYRKMGHSRTRGTVAFLDLFKKLKTLNFKVYMVI